MVGGVPSRLRQRRVDFGPVAGVVGAGSVGSGGEYAVTGAAGLEDGTVGEDGGGGAQGVAEDGEGADGVGGDVVLNGVGGAVDGVVGAISGREGDVGGADIGSVEDEDAVGVEELHVHG